MLFLDANGHGTETAVSGSETIVWDPETIVLRTIEVPYETLEQLNGSLKITGENIKLSKIPIEKVLVSATAGNGVINFDEIKSDFLGGSQRGNMTINTAKKKVQVRIQSKITNIDIKKINHITKISEQLEGFINANIKLTTEGTNIQEITITSAKMQ